MTTDNTIQHTQHRVLAEEEDWHRAVRSIFREDAELVSMSRYIGDPRVYRGGGRLAKIRSLRVELPAGVSRLDAEAKILKRLGQEIDYVKTDAWEGIVLSPIDGVPLEQLLPTLSLAARTKLLLRLLPELRRTHAAHVAHRDLRLDNVLVGADGKPYLIDFDRATLGTAWSVGLADWLGIAPSGLSANPYWKLVLFTLAPRTRTLARRIRAQVVKAKQPLPGLPAEPDLMLLAKAWSLAQRSAANAPGQQVAYQAFTYKNQHFPGERPWYLRWEAIRRAVNFKGKRLVELGSNMGLLSSFALMHGATEAIGVDHDRHIIESARLVAQALGTGATFERIDLVNDPGWESKVAGADIVVAMSLLHWLPDPDRVLRFLGTHDEVIYEGHDPVDIEIAKLRSVGFDNVSIIGETERGRALLYGRNVVAMKGGATR